MTCDFKRRAVEACNKFYGPETGRKLRQYIRKEIESMPECEVAKKVDSMLCIIHRDGGHYIDEHGHEKAYQDAVKILHEWKVQANEDLAAANAKIAELTAHAERYRYLRDDSDGFEITIREVNDDGQETWVAGYPADELDAAIDAARKACGE